MKGLLRSKLNPECLKYLQQISHFQELWKVSADISQDFYVGLKKTTIITSAGASTRIEGATLSDEEIQKKLVGLKIQKIVDRDSAEVAGYLDCKKYIFDFFAELPVSEHTIRSLHQMMMSYLSEDIFPSGQKGAYKNITNSVARVDHATGEQEIIFETTPPGPQTEIAMRELVDDYHSYIRDPNYADLEVVAAFIVKFLAIHPFRDGNGRISRLLTDLCLLKQGYEFFMYSSHEKMIEDTKAQYYVALRQTQAGLTDHADLNPWFYYFLRVISQQTQFLADKIIAKKSGTFTEKENIIFQLIQKHQPVTISFLERETAFKRVTLKSILARMKNRGFILMEGTKKGSRYKIKN